MKLQITVTDDQTAPETFGPPHLDGHSAGSAPATRQHPGTRHPAADPADAGRAPVHTPVADADPGGHARPASAAPAGADALDGGGVPSWLLEQAAQVGANPPRAGAAHDAGSYGAT
ncbi:hypothetical protein [Kitasatospora camelliae]|uniref:Uncharacterized protein n=1 Tax=Kitasatospora camelliae TaxID=3156397 RepID=A0AAU8K8K5_9ACTN